MDRISSGRAHGITGLQYTGCIYSIFSAAGAEAMSDEDGEKAARASDALSRWHLMLKDKAALLARPGTHHKALLDRANALHQEQTINSDDLSDLLELADGALAFAVEMMLDFESDD